MTDLPLVGTIRIHGPDFFMAGAVRDEIYLSSEQRGAAHLGYDIGGEFMRGFLSSSLVRRAEIALAQHLRLRNCRLPDIEQPAVQDQYVVLDRRITECQIIAGNRRRRPVREPGTATIGWLLAGTSALGC